MNYFELINKYFGDNPAALSMYIVHVTLVTNKALGIAKKLNLSEELLKFIEEASMLHDIGCSKVSMPEFGIDADLPYLCHMTEGQKILEEEGLPKHARVASTHTGVGISAEDIRKNKLPIPEQDYFPESIEEKIISYADLFFSKNPDELLNEKSLEEVTESLRRFGEEKVEIFNQWRKEFGEQ